MTLSRGLSHVVAISLLLLALLEKYQPLFLVYGMNKVITFAIALLFLAMGIWNGRVQLSHFDRKVILLFVLCAFVSALSIPFQPANQEDLLIGWFNFVFRTMVMYLAISIATKALSDMQLPIVYFIAAGAFFAVGSVLVMLLHALLPEFTATMMVSMPSYEIAEPATAKSFLYLVGYTNHPQFRAANYFTEPSKFAQFMILPLALVTLPKYRKKTSYRIIFIFMLAAFLLSQSAAVLAGCLLAVLVTDYQQRNGHFSWVSLGVVVLLALLLAGAYWMTATEGDRVLEALDKTDSAFSRLLEPISVWNWVREYPMGIGWGKPTALGIFEQPDLRNFSFDVARLADFVSYKGPLSATIWILEMLLKGGWLVALLYVLISVKIVQLSLSLLKAGNPLYVRLGFSVLALFLGSLTNGPLEQKVMLVSLGLAVAASRCGRSVAKRTHPDPV